MCFWPPISTARSYALLLLDVVPRVKRRRTGRSAFLARWQSPHHVAPYTSIAVGTPSRHMLWHISRKTCTLRPAVKLAAVSYDIVSGNAWCQLPCQLTAAVASSALPAPRRHSAMNATQIIITCATKLNQMSTPMIAANGASIGLRDAPVNRRAPSSCITATARAQAPPPPAWFARAYVRDHAQQQHEQREIQQHAGSETGRFQQQRARQRIVGDAKRPQHQSIRPPETTPAAVDNMNSTATMIAATVSRNRALTTFSSCVQSSNMVVTALRRNSSNR